MLAIAILLLVSVTVAIGLYMGLRYLKRQRNTPGVIGTHFLLGALTLEPMLIGLRGGIGLAPVRPSLAGSLAAGLIAVALFTGITAVMIGRKSRQTANIALGTHAAVAGSAYILLWVWVVTK